MKIFQSQRSRYFLRYVILRNHLKEVYLLLKFDVHSLSITGGNGFAPRNTAKVTDLISLIKIQFAVGIDDFIEKDRKKRKMLIKKR